jgi:NADH:ubiquinone oxidoreductase subunit 2 (subunit N)
MLLLLILGSMLSLFYYLSLLFSLFLSSIKRKQFILKNIHKNHFVVFIGMFLNLIGGCLLLFNDFLLSW